MLGPANVCLAKEIEPNSFRATFCIPIDDNDNFNQEINLIHGSLDDEEFEKDIRQFFPIERTLAMIKPDAYANCDEIVEQIEQAGFYIDLSKSVHLTKELAEIIFKDCVNKPFYNDLINHMIR